MRYLSPSILNTVLRVKESVQHGGRDEWVVADLAPRSDDQIRRQNRRILQGALSGDQKEGDRRVDLQWQASTSSIYDDVGIGRQHQVRSLHFDSGDWSRFNDYFAFVKLDY